MSQVRQLVAIAALSGRVAVLPTFACSAPWLHRAASGRVDDLRVVPDHLAPGDRGGGGGGGGRGGGGGGDYGGDGGGGGYAKPRSIPALPSRHALLTLTLTLTLTLP